MAEDSVKLLILYILVAAALCPGIFRLAPTLYLTGFSSHRMGNSIISGKFRTQCRKGEGGLPACLPFFHVCFLIFCLSSLVLMRSGY